MFSDKKVLYSISFSAFAALLLILLLSARDSSRIIAAVVMAVGAVCAILFIKKRSILSIHKQQILLLMGVIGALYVMAHYVSGLYFGFYKNGYGLRFSVLWQFILPVVGITVASEWLRRIVRAQNSRAADVLIYLACVAGEVLIKAGQIRVNTFGQAMDFFGLSLFPAITANLLYHYLSKRYGAAPNILYRLLSVIPFYIIPYQSAISKSLLAFANLIIPLVIWLFIDSLYEKKRRYALGKKSVFSKVLTVVTVSIMALVIMLISNQFRFGALVIATESMTGELNKGDVAIFERFEDQVIEPGQIIVFENSDSMVVHRVVDIHYINGSTRYFTKGDCNEANDTGFVTDSRVVGLVKLKAPYIGFPTLWLRSLFS